ncbi:hormone-sensitive lipase isoform X2 [Agrilus planipennis]|uniref:Hormone-sensitive lipase isoform X2 n=1 Tax=Agrilus planipennis TaxID=224129 RepID=A0A1W4XVD1_AGRPL|nr:hormone-sensitive lipase isoform X2 [Agrilus planipennis]
MTDAESFPQRKSEESEDDNTNSSTLNDLCKSNSDYFVNDNTENGQRLYTSFLTIADNLNSLAITRKKIESVVHNFDYDENTPANGYRSFLKVVDYAIAHSLQVIKKVSLKRDGVLFRKAVITKDVEACAHLLASLNNCLILLTTLLEWSSETELFPKEKRSPEEIILKTETINRYCFYGRCLGFQFCESIKPTLQMVAFAMAVFSEAYFSRSYFTKATNSVISTATYLTDPEQRAKTIVNVSQTANIDFCKSFWFLSESELMHNLPSVIRAHAYVAVTKILLIPPKPLTLTINGQDIDIPIPESHIGKKTIQVRLISSNVREGMVGEASKKTNLPPSKGLLFHCHGGGFVAQSSKSHEIYLRLWARDLNVPILSVDYSLAPQAPYPRAIEEITYAYCWALKNCHLLGSTGETIIAAGDSAGANLLLGTCLKCATMNVPPPKGLFLAYVPTLINFVPSPARLLCLMDPLLPFGFMMRCLKAYAGTEKSSSSNDSDMSSFEEITHSDLADLQAHKSPTSEISDTLSNESFESQSLEGGNEFQNVEGLEDNNIDENVLYEAESNGSRSKINQYQDSISNSYSFIQRSLTGFVSNLKEHVGSWIPGTVQNIPEDVIHADKEKSIVDELKFEVPEDPFLSPYLASDEMLITLPPLKLLVCNHLD